MGRNVVLWGALLAIAGLTFLTVRVAVHDGIDIIVVISVIVLVLMGVGVLGALNAPSDD
jgi:asparagine N-glycosylation enzyme membrane subunit Stt3